MTLIPGIIGVVGAAMILLTYALLQLGKMAATGLWYTVINLVGSLLILYSLFYDFNLAGLIIEIVWISVSVVALVRLAMKRRRRQTSE